MVQEQWQSGSRILFQCEECGFLYREKEWAEKCEAWCSTYQSCNLEIIEHGEPPHNNT